MTVKFICAAVIVISCSYVGIKLSNSLRVRVRMLSEILAAIGQIEISISTVRMPLTEIYSSLSTLKGATGEFFKRVEPGISWKNQLDILTGLTAQDKALLTELSEKLGSYETERQIDELRRTQSLLTAALGQARTEMTENSRVYRSMSFFTGIVIAILLI